MNMIEMTSKGYLKPPEPKLTLSPNVEGMGGG